MASLDLVEKLEQESGSPLYSVRGRSPAEVGQLLGAIEREVARDFGACLIEGPDGRVALRTGQRVYRSGLFEVPTLGELREAAAAIVRTQALGEREAGPDVAAFGSPGGGGSVTSGAPGEGLRLSALVGASPLADIGTLQALLGDGVVFQAASQFNCLEAPSSRVVPVADYVLDPTQGPRASVSAFPGTFHRHYRAPRPAPPATCAPSMSRIDKPWKSAWWSALIRYVSASG